MGKSGEGRHADAQGAVVARVTSPKGDGSSGDPEVDFAGYPEVDPGSRAQALTRRAFLGAATGAGALVLGACVAPALCHGSGRYAAFASEGSDADDGAVSEMDGAVDADAVDADDVAAEDAQTDASADAALSSDANTAGTGTDFGSYPVYVGTEQDEYGLTVLTAAAAGHKLEKGKSYCVKGKITLGKFQSRSAGLVAQNNLIYLYDEARLIALGGNGALAEPGLPGIALEEGMSLCVVGNGRLRAEGGSAGDGSNGSRGGNGFSTKDGSGYYRAGAGGAGGAGGGGGGAGIGTAGSQGGAGGAEVPGSTRPHNATEEDGKDGKAGACASAAKPAGCLCLGGCLDVSVKGGRERFNGQGGDCGTDDVSFYFPMRSYNAAYGGGGGGGGTGGVANSIGTGGTGGTGGGSGGTGGLCYKNRPRYRCPAHGGGGCGGLSGFCSNNRSYRRGEKGKGQWCHTEVDGGRGASASDARGPDPVFPQAGTILVAKNAEGKNTTAVDGYVWNITGLNEHITTVDGYAGFSQAQSNAAWFLLNDICNEQGDSKTNASIVSVLSLTPVTDIEKQLRERKPQREGYTFLGYEIIEGELFKDYLFYDAVKDAFDWAELKAKCYVGKDGTSVAGVWMHTAPVTFKAKWKVSAPDPVCTVEYKANGSTFQDATGATVDSYREENIPIGKTYYLWDGKTHYTVKPPAGKSTDAYELLWCMKADGTGETRSPGEGVYVSVKAGETITMYAVWLEKENKSTKRSRSRETS